MLEQHREENTLLKRAKTNDQLYLVDGAGQILINEIVDDFVHQFVPGL
jgi:hypothetical protein